MIVEEIDLAGSDKTNAEIEESGQLPLFNWLDAHASLMKIMMPVAGAALIILILIVIAVSGGSGDKKTVKQPFISSAPRQEEAAETENAMNGQEVQNPGKAPEPAAKQETDTSQVMEPDAAAAIRTDSNQAGEIREMKEKLAEAENGLQVLHDMIFGESGQSTYWRM